MAKSDGLPAQFAMQLSRFPPKMERWDNHAMAVPNGARCRISRCNGAGMAIHNHDAPRANFDECFGHFLDHGGQRRNRKRDAASDPSEAMRQAISSATM